MSVKLLQVENITLASSKGVIIENLTFSIAPGEIVALTGKSGSGKTTIAMALLDLLPPTIQMSEGNIQWTGKDQKTINLSDDHDSWARLRGRHIGYSQQDMFSTFDPTLSMGKQMIMIINERTGQPAFNVEKELRSKMVETGLQDIDRLLISYPHQLSGGQLQRCQIAMSIVIMPELLITDEPTSAIDKINQVELLEVFSMLRSKYNMAILCITHEEAVVRQLADKEVRLDIITQHNAVTDSRREDEPVLDQKVVLEVKDLVYNHIYGGMTHQTGARVGTLDFKLMKGVCLGVVGESGSGKSTLAQLLVGLYVPSEGIVIVDDRQIDFRKSSDIRHLRSKVQLVMQDGRGSLHPNHSIKELLAEVLHQKKLNGNDTSFRIHAVLTQVDLPESILIRKAGQLSGGECLRVSLARALLMQPQILICDESTSSLDGPTRDGIIELLKKLMRENALSMIFISHDEQIIRHLAHHILVMSDGKIIEQGLSKEVISYSTHPVTKKIFSVNATIGKKRASLDQNAELEE